MKGYFKNQEKLVRLISFSNPSIFLKGHSQTMFIAIGGGEEVVIKGKKYINIDCECPLRKYCLLDSLT